MPTSSHMIYLDHAATTPVGERVVEAMLPFFSEKWGNPSSVYAQGREARRGLDDARDTLSDVLGCRPNELIFTSGGSESDNLAIKGVAFARGDRGRHIVTSKIEHHAVLHTCEWLEKYFGYEVSYLEVDKDGLVHPDDLGRALRDDTILVSIMYANNEIGTVEPIADLVRVAKGRRADIVFHTDAVQVAGSLPLDLSELGVDLLSLSAHKFYGPKGMGLLFTRRGTPLLSQVQGGGQERGMRSGTENVAGAVGMATALALAHQELEARAAHAGALRDELVEGVLASVPKSQLTGHPVRRLPNNASFVFPGADGESLLLNLDQLGVAASSGSACTSGTLEVSHVLRAIRVSESAARGSLRLTTGMATRAEDVPRVLEALPAVVERVRQLAPAMSSR